MSLNCALDVKVTTSFCFLIFSCKVKEDLCVNKTVGETFVLSEKNKNKSYGPKLLNGSVLMTSNTTSKLN